MSVRNLITFAAAGVLTVLATACGGPDATGTLEQALVGVPTTLDLSVKETGGVARQGEVIRSGVPVPKSLNLTGTGALAVVDAQGTAVPAEFEVLARWNDAKSSAAPIEWLLVTFPASVGANATSGYRLVWDGSAGANPAPAQPVRVTEAGNQITVDTGAATFVVDGATGGLFKEIRAGGQQLVSGGALEGTVDGRAVQSGGVRRVSIEHQGPLTAIVVVEGTYDMPEVGGGGLASRRRYVFTSGSPTAIVRHSVAWEGDRCMSTNGPGMTQCGGAPNALRVAKLRDSLSLASSGSLNVTVAGARNAAALNGAIASGQTAHVRQHLRAQRTDALAFDAAIGANATSGAAADGAVLSANGVAIALDHMHRYEPQALRVLADGKLAIDIADDQAWIGARQGLFATLAVSAIGGGDVSSKVWAPLNHPLRAWPTAQWLAASKAVEDFPVGQLPADLAGYDTLVTQTLNQTVAKRDGLGLTGLMTTGLFPRYWGGVMYGDEIRCDGNDPTPGEAWDNTYWCTSFTDYHNGMMIPVVRAMRTGEVEWLTELSAPGALRTLHTQIYQCAPGDTWFYCGQAPAGYGGYRADFNSSHAYFENLMHYYWLTGDKTVVETLQRGSSSMRNYLCSKRPSASCTATDLPADEWAQLSGRVASQWFSTFRFVGLASDDASYLDDWRTGLARAVTQKYVETADGAGFWTPPATTVTGAGSFNTDQVWMVSLYDMNNLYRLERETENAPIGSPAIPPSQAQAGWAKTLVRYAAANGAGGQIPNALSFSYSGARIGGAIGTVGAYAGGSDPNLYDTGKATLTAQLVRGGKRANDPAMSALGAQMVRNAIAAGLTDGSPISKPMGEFLARLHAAVAEMMPDVAGGAPPAPAVTAAMAPAPASAPAPAVEPAPAPQTDVTEPDAPVPPAPETTSTPVAPAPAPEQTPVVLQSAAASGVVSAAMSAEDMAARLTRGVIEMTYRPSYDSSSDDDRRHALFTIGDVYGPPSLMLEESDALRFVIKSPDWSTTKVEADWHGALWHAGETVQIRVEWDSALKFDAMKIYVNGQRVDHGGVNGGWSAAAGRPTAFTGAANAAGEFGAEGAIDGVTVRSAPAL